MFNIASYLERFRNLGQNEKMVKEEVVLAVRESLGLDLESKDIVIKNGAIIFKVSPAMKNAIYIKKADILNRLGEKGVKNLSEIR